MVQKKKSENWKHNKKGENKIKGGIIVKKIKREFERIMIVNIKNNIIVHHNNNNNNIAI